MAKRNVPPTKSNLILLRHELVFTREGFGLLDEKRQILVIELMRHVERAKRIQRALDEAMAKAYEALRAAVLAAGRRSLGGLAVASPVVRDLHVRSQRLMGLYLPRVEFPKPAPRPRFGLSRTPVPADELYRIFTGLLVLIGELAEVENTVMRLARELKKTQRRVNALEKLFIPETVDTLKYISDTLEERDREALGVMRIVKRRGETTLDAPPEQPVGAQADREGSNG
ncbi:MAG: V-type ATP synthase subunit D [Planctomycetota bacterium]